MLATHQRMLATTYRRSHACGSVCDCLLEVFSLVDRSGRGDSNGGVTGWKQCRKKLSEKFSGSRGDLMAVEGFKNEGGVIRIWYDH